MAAATSSGGRRRTSRGMRSHSVGSHPARRTSSRAAGLRCGPAEPAEPADPAGEEEVLRPAAGKLLVVIVWLTFQWVESGATEQPEPGRVAECAEPVRFADHLDRAVGVMQRELVLRLHPVVSGIGIPGPLAERSLPANLVRAAATASG